jgi:putative transcriptional regulator
VKAIRTRQGLTQEEFAARYGFAVSAVREWEQKRRMPDPAARAYLVVIDREPEAVARALQAA